MTPLTKSILAGIAVDDEEAFLGAEEMAMAFAFGTGPNVGLIEPYLRSLQENPPQAEDIEAIKHALVRYLEVGKKANAASAVFALGKIQDPSLVPFLREQLQEHLSVLLKQNAIVGNLICALSNRGERIISGNSYSLTEVDKNLHDARSYLQEFGIILPW